MLGEVYPGEQAEAFLSVQNAEDATVTIDRIETSCLCVNVGAVPVVLGPHEMKDLKVTFNPLNDPEFEGRLSVEVTGYLTDGRIGFRTRVNVETEPEAKRPPG